MAMVTSDLRGVTEVVDRNRIMRERARWSGLEELTTLAKIEVLEHGGTTRPIITRGGKHLRSRLVSRKTSRVQITEGKGLRFLCRMCEINGYVLDYQAHPFRVTAVVDGLPIEWYPDLVYILADGTIGLIEVKRSPRDLRKAEYRAKLEAFRDIFGLCGWKMCIRYDKDIFGHSEVRGTRATNVGAVYSRRFLTVDDRETDILAGLVHAASPVAWDDAALHLSPDDPLRGDALVEYAIARGHFSIDFDEPLGPSTRLTPIVAAGAVGTIRI
jgi:hypothetical protein